MKKILSHGGWASALALFACLLGALPSQAADNQLTSAEKKAGWILLFDGQNANGWKLPNGKALPDANASDGTINPHKSGGGWTYYDKKFGNFVLACDFKVSKDCNSGLFFLVGDPKDEVYSGIEMQVYDSAGKKKPGKHDCGAIYDIMAPKYNAMKPAGKWNHVEVKCKGSDVDITLNKKHIIHMDLSQWTEPGKNPDGTTNKFKSIAYKDLARPGYIGFQDHGRPVWYKNIKIKPLGSSSARAPFAPVNTFVSAPLPPQKPKKRVLLITESKGFVHSVVRRPKEGGFCLVEKTFQDLGKKTGMFEVVCSQDSRKDLTAENLTNFDVVWFYTTGTLPLSETQKADLINFVRKGGGFGGCHSATDTFYNWPEYGQLIGAYFDGHPWHQKVKVIVEDKKHPATKHLGNTFIITDEIYQFRSPYSRENLKVLMKLDMSDLKNKGKRKDEDNALAWTHTLGKGRVFYTALGHREDVWEDPRYQQHIVGGLMYLFGMDNAPIPRVAPAPDVKKD